MANGSGLTPVDLRRCTTSGRGHDVVQCRHAYVAVHCLPSPGRRPAIFVLLSSVVDVGTMSRSI